MFHRAVFLFFLFLIAALPAFSQKIIAVSGRVTDSSGLALEGASVKLRSDKDSTGWITGKNGAFSLQVTGERSIELRVSTIGYTPFIKTYKDPTALIDAGMIKLVPEPAMMPEVIVTSVNPIIIKEDTVEYKTSAYKVREGAPVEDVIKKLPGVTVDKDGQISAQGKPVARVRVNGKDFFGGDAQTAMQNLPAEIIDNIQIIDDYGDEANLTGIKSGEPEKIININIRKDKSRGRFGNITAGAGDNGRYAGGIVANKFDDEQQISFLAAVNNTNTNLFNFNGGGKGGGARGANFGNLDRVGAGNGITLSRSAGLNYKDKWGKNIAVNGSYSYSSRNTTTLTNSLQQDINPMNIRSTNRTSDNRSGSQNHRITFNLEYRIDSVNFIKISPYLSLSSATSANSSQSAISRKNYYTFNTNQSAGKSNSPNSGVDLTYNHKFSKRGRGINLFASINYSYRDQDQRSRNTYDNDDSTSIPVLHKDTIQQQAIDTRNKNTRTLARLSYTEPIGNTHTLLELNYEWNRSSTSNIRSVDDIDPLTGQTRFNATQSNYFNYQFVTNRIGLNIKGSQAKYNYVIGIISQPSSLSGQSVGKGVNTNYRNINWIPSARFVYNIARSHSLTLTYNGTSREPGFMQLQPVTDSSNLNNIIVGNPDLQAELTQRLSLQYNKFDNKSGRSLFTNLSFDQTGNKIVNNRFNNPSGTGRTTTYLNTDGFYNINANGALTRPFSNRKFSVTAGIAANYNNNISFTDNQRTKGNNWNLRPSASVRVDLDDIVDASVNVSYTVYKTTTRYTDFTNVTKARTLAIGINGKNYFFKDLTLGYEFSKNINYGFSSNVNSNPVILNLYTEYRFLKNNRAAVRLQGFDLFNENTGITRTVYETTITDSRTNRLARYFLLSFNFRMQSFSGDAQHRQNRRG